MSVTTVSSSMITDATILNADIGAAAAIATTKLGAGATVQVVHAVELARVTGTTVSVADDTIPQKTEGVEFLTLAITPTNSSNKLLIQARIVTSHTTALALTIMALFQDDTANALACCEQQAPPTTVTRPHIMVLEHYMAAGTTSATTFKIRAGSNSSGTIDINSQGGARTLGGVENATITITEIKV